MANIQVLIDAKVAGLGEVGALDASVQKLGTSTAGLGADLEKTTGQLNVAGVAHAATAKEAEALGSTMAQSAVQAESMGVQAEGLAAKLGTLQGAAGLGGVNVAAANTGVVMEDLAATTATTAASTATATDAMAASSTAITELAAVDGTLAAKKKESTAAVGEESAAVEKSKAAHEAHAEAVMKGVKATGEFGTAGVEASEKLSALAGILGPAGGVSLGLAGFVVGAGAAVAIAKSGIDSFVEFGEAVLKFQRITGMTAESSSKLLDVFHLLGVDADTADKAMFQLAHRTEELGGGATKTEKTLRDLGVEVAKNADGSTNLEKTLLNVADAYAASSEGANRDAIAYAAFGKASASMIPVLTQGSAALERMSNDAQRVFDQAQLEQVHQYNVEMAKAGQEIDKTKDSIGGALVPALGSTAKAFNELGEAQRSAAAKGETQGRAMQGLGHQNLEVLGQEEKLAEQSRKNAAAADAESAAIKRLNDELKAEEQDRQALLDGANKSIQASLQMEHAAQNVTNAEKALGDETVKDSEYANKHQAALDKVAAAQANYTAVVKAHGPESLAAKTAQDQLNAAIDASTTLDRQNADAASALSATQLQLKDAMLADSLAARDLAEQQAELSGGHLSAKEAAAAQAAELEKLKGAAGGVLPAELQALLDKLNSFHDVNVNVNIGVTGSEAAIAAGYVNPGRQHGGDVRAGEWSWVGEAGPELVHFDRPAHVYPHGVTPASPGPAAMRVEASTDMTETNTLLRDQNGLLRQMLGLSALGARDAALRYP